MKNEKEFSKLFRIFILKLKIETLNKKFVLISRLWWKKNWKAIFRKILRSEFLSFRILEMCSDNVSFFVCLMKNLDWENQEEMKEDLMNYFCDLVIPEIFKAIKAMNQKKSIIFDKENLRLLKRLLLWHSESYPILSSSNQKTKFSSPNCSLQRFFGSVRLDLYPGGKSTASHFLVHLSQKKKMWMTLLLMQMPSW